MWCTGAKSGHLGTKYLPLKYFHTFTLDICECMCICCLDVDCMNAYIIITSMFPVDSPHGAYGLCPYVCPYLCPYVCKSAL